MGFRAGILWLLMCFALDIDAQNLPESDGGHSAFERGSQAYKAKDYQSALTHFNQAWAAGNSSATLLYNRGVVLYRLERLDEAKQVFISLLLNTQWVHVARYNLGRIAEDQQDYTSAHDHYLKVFHQADNENLRRLAEQKLATLDKPVDQVVPTTDPVQKIDTSSVLLSAGLTADNNAMSLADDLGQSASDASDIYHHALVYGHYYVDGQQDSGIKLYGLAYDRRFQTHYVFDATILGLGGTKEMTIRDLRGEVGVRITRAWVYAGYLANQYTILSKWEKPLSLGIAELQYHSTYYDAADNFAHLAGWQHQLQLGWQYDYGQIRLEPALRLQTNQREDKQSATQIYSYSPTSIGLLMDVKWKLAEKWELFGNAVLSRASYSGENQLTDLGGINRQEKRENTHAEVAIGVKYQLSPRWSVKADFSHRTISDNYDIYSYGKQTAGVKVEWVH